MESKKRTKILDVNVFGRIMSYASAYKKLFLFSGLCSILLAIAAALRPYLVTKAIDEYVYTKTQEGFLMCLLSVRL